MHAMQHIHRYLVAFLTVFCLLSAQQGAAAHALSHFSGGQSAPSDKHLPHSKSCDKCAIYAELSGAAPAAAPLVFHVLDSATESFSFLLQYSPSTTVWAYVARAPPYLL